MGLALNAAKTSLIEINLCDEEVASKASELGCKVDQLTFVYQGFPLGGKATTKEARVALEEKFKTKIGKWHGLVLSKGSRLILCSVG